MTDEDEENDTDEDTQNNNEDGQHHHRFNKPDHLKEMLESGSIPDAAMIHAARKRRQKAREEGQQQQGPNYPITSNSKYLFFK